MYSIRVAEHYTKTENSVAEHYTKTENSVATLNHKNKNQNQKPKKVLRCFLAGSNR